MKQFAFLFQTQKIMYSLVEVGSTFVSSVNKAFRSHSDASRWIVIVNMTTNIVIVSVIFVITNRRHHSIVIIQLVEEVEAQQYSGLQHYNPTNTTFNSKHINIFKYVITLWLGFR